MAKQFFDEGEWTPERLKNIGGDLSFEDLGGRFISHEVGHAELTQEGHETILREIKGSSPRQRDRRKAYMAGLPGGDMRDEQLASEIGAEIRSEGFGYTSAMVEAVLGGQKHSIISKVLSSSGAKYADKVREARGNAQSNFPGGFDDLDEPEFDNINFGDLVWGDERKDSFGAPHANNTVLDDGYGLRLRLRRIRRQDRCIGEDKVSPFGLCHHGAPQEKNSGSA